MKRTTGRGPKDKGRAFENEIRTALLKALPSLSSNDIAARSMGDSGVDLILSQAARDLIPFAIELKRTERLNLKEALAQTEANAVKREFAALSDIQAQPWPSLCGSATGYIPRDAYRSSRNIEKR